MMGLLADMLVIAGLAILTIGVYGVFRLPDAYTQLHAASKAGFVGVTLLLVSAALQGGPDILSRVILAVVLLTLTTPVAAYAMARAARVRGEPLCTPGAVDEAPREGEVPD